MDGFKLNVWKEHESVTYLFLLRIQTLFECLYIKRDGIKMGFWKLIIRSLNFCKVDIKVYFYKYDYKIRFILVHEIVHIYLLN